MEFTYYSNTQYNKVKAVKIARETTSYGCQVPQHNVKFCPWDAQLLTYAASLLLTRDVDFQSQAGNVSLFLKKNIMYNCS